MKRNGQTGLCLKNPKMSSTDYLDDYNYNYSIYIDDDFAPLCENHEASLFGGVFAQVFYSLIFLLSLTGNILVLWILMKYEKLKTVTDIFILNLVTSDLLFSCSLPFWAVDHAHGWIFGKAMCKIMSSIFFIGYYSGIMLLTLITLDRYFAVVHALSAVRIRKVCYGVVTCVVVWCISILATVPETIFSDVVADGRESFSCHNIYPKGSEVTWKMLGYYQQNILFFLIPFSVIVLSYYKIFSTVVKCKARKKHKAVRVIFCIVVVFFLCWTPYNIVIFLISLIDQMPLLLTCSVENHLIYALFICRNLAYFHCCLNPFFYVFVGTKFREHFMPLASKRFPYLKTCTEISSTKQNSSQNYWDVDFHLHTLLEI
ncbi:chemokine XC receptor 1-like isoform X2 [Narcine bancroftii]|uniref:chemokine XC receptor 1-like isoform X2 n=1 Tax=Narcine bancroftii TaxID=1343680 RepID=UPI0038311759